MAKRDVVLTNFLQNPLTSELCGLSPEELAKVSFSESTNDPVIDSLRRMIISAIDNDEPTTTTISAVNSVLNRLGGSV